MRSRKAALIMLIIPMVLLFAGLAYASGAEDSPWSTSKLAWRVVNTIALIILLGYFLKKPLANFFAERTTQIRKDLEEARGQRDRAQQLLAEYKTKLAGMEQELEKMRAELRKSGEAEGDKVLDNAERMAAAMVESARVTAEQEVRKAKVELKSEAVELAVQMAESLIREKINEDDRKRIVEDYLVKVGGMK